MFPKSVWNPAKTILIWCLAHSEQQLKARTRNFFLAIDFQHKFRSLWPGMLRGFGATSGETSKNQPQRLLWSNFDRGPRESSKSIPSDFLIAYSAEGRECFKTDPQQSLGCHFGRGLGNAPESMPRSEAQGPRTPESG